MSKHRTRAEKIRAAQRLADLARLHEVNRLSTPAILPIPRVSAPEEPATPTTETPGKRDFLIDTVGVKRDLLRTLTAIVLALALEIGVYSYLR
jgi:hypothetical protein